MKDLYGQAFHPSAGKVIAKVDNEGKITLLVPKSEWDAIMERGALNFKVGEIVTVDAGDGRTLTILVHKDLGGGDVACSEIQPYGLIFNPSLWVTKKKKK